MVLSGHTVNVYHHTYDALGVRRPSPNPHTSTLDQALGALCLLRTRMDTSSVLYWPIFEEETTIDSFITSGFELTANKMPKLKGK